MHFCYWNRNLTLFIKNCLPPKIDFTNAKFLADIYAALCSFINPKYCNILFLFILVLSAGALKLLEEYKDADPNFTIRRHHDQALGEIQQVESLRNVSLR